VSVKRTLTDKLSLSVNAEAGDGKADSLIAGRQTDSPGEVCGDTWASTALHPQPPALPLALALGLALGQAGASPFALLQRRGELGHLVQCRPLLGRDGR